MNKVKKTLMACHCNVTLLHILLNFTWRLDGQERISQNQFHIGGITVKLLRTKLLMPIGRLCSKKRFDGSVDFYLGWNDYEQGFESLDGKLWFGLSKIHGFT